MSLFDGILIVSDFDGTLAYREQISETNKNAIRYFMENGGKFSVGSGRYFGYLCEKLGDLICNAPLMCCNGAVIADQRTGKTLFEGLCSPDLFDMIEDVLALNVGYHEVRLYPNDSDASLLLSPAEFSAQKETLRAGRYYKALFHTDTAEHGKLGAELANQLPYPNFMGARSWDTSLEVMMKKNAKDAGLFRIKEMVGARIAVAVGDYENDIPMLSCADLSYAVSGGSEATIKAAKKTCKSAVEGAIADVIEDLKRLVQNGEI